MNEKSSLFLKWFNGLGESDQSDVIDLVYDEFKVRGWLRFHQPFAGAEGSSFGEVADSQGCSRQVVQQS